VTAPLIDPLHEVWSDIADLCDGLTGAQWETPTDCPGWTVRDNVAHMIGTERMLMGEQPGARAEAGDAPVPAHVRNDIGKANERWIETYLGWEGPKLLDEFRAVTARRLDQLRALTSEEWEREGFTPEGPGPYRQFMAIRVFDCWYHDQDIREALDRPGLMEGLSADLSLRRIIQRGMPYVVGKKAAAPQGARVRFDLSAPALTADVVVDGRAAAVPSDPGRAPTTLLALDRRTFARLAGGRWTGSHARAHGSVRVDGDQELGDRIIDNMAFTI
jgi:uncharacterized protein (TIGR03083 family)